MKKEVLLVLFFFIAFNSYSQKKEVYILGKDTVSKKHYLEVSNSKSTKFYKSIKYKDSKTISSRLVKRYRIGYLSFQQFVFIKLHRMSFQVTFATKWSDFDPNRHMRHTAYNEYAAEVRVRYFTAQKFSIEEFTKHILVLFYLLKKRLLEKKFI